MKGVPGDVGDAFDALQEAVERFAEDMEPLPSGDSVQAELGFPLDPDAPVDPDKVRGNYDVSRLEKNNPKLVRAIAALLSMHFLRHDAIARMVGVSWETVAAIAATRRESIREFKGRMEQRLRFIGEAMLPVLLDQIRHGKVSMLDLKLWHEVWAPLAGEATTIVETRDGAPALEGFLAMIRDEAAKHAPAMGCEEGKLCAGAPTPSPAVIEAEYLELGTPNDSQSPTRRA